MLGARVAQGRERSHRPVVGDEHGRRAAPRRTTAARRRRHRNVRVPQPGRTPGRRRRPAAPSVVDTKPSMPLAPRFAGSGVGRVDPRRPAGRHVSVRSRTGVEEPTPKTEPWGREAGGSRATRPSKGSDQASIMRSTAARAGGRRRARASPWRDQPAAAGAPPRPHPGRPPQTAPGRPASGVRLAGPDGRGGRGRDDDLPGGQQRLPSRVVGARRPGGPSDDAPPARRRRRPATARRLARDPPTTRRATRPESGSARTGTPERRARQGQRLRRTQTHP